MSRGRGFRRLNDRRTARRVPVNRVFMHAHGEDGSVAPKDAVKLVCLDVSEHGCRALSVGRVLTVGDVLRIVFTPTMRGDAGIRARVVRSERVPGGRCEVAFSFDRLAPTDRVRINEWHAWWGRSSDGNAEKAAEAARERARDDERIDALNALIRGVRTERDTFPGRF
jgi:hypothetical protein